MWLPYALASAVFAALTAVLAKIGIRGIDSDLATAIRTVVVLLLAWGIVLWRGGLRQVGGLTSTNWTFLILSGLATGLSWLCYFRALQLGEASRVAPVDKLSVALVVIFAGVFLGEVITLRMGFGVALILGGTLLLIR